MELRLSGKGLLGQSKSLSGNSMNLNWIFSMWNCPHLSLWDAGEDFSHSENELMPLLFKDLNDVRC